MDSTIKKIDFFIENFVPYESKSSIEPIDDRGYKVRVSFYDTILNKMVKEYLFFTKDGDLIQN